MARTWGSIRLAALCIGLAIFCVLAYFLLLYLVSPHPQHVDYPIPSDLPPSATVYPGGYIVMSGYDGENYTAAHPGTIVDNSGADSSVSFWQLPLWIQLNALPMMIFGLATSFFAIISVVRRVRKNENDNKQAILTYISGNPGCTAPELSRDRGMNIGTARYHIKKLEDEGRIVLARIGKFSRLFVNRSTYDEREKLIAAHLRNDASKAIIQAIMDTPGINNQKLSEKLDMEKSLVYRYVQKLLDDGILNFEWEGKNKQYYVNASAKEALIKLMPLHYQCPGLMRE